MLSDILLELNNYQARFTNSVKNLLNNNKLRLKKLTDSYILKNPLSLYEVKEQHLDNIIDKLNFSINGFFE